MLHVSLDDEGNEIDETDEQADANKRRENGPPELAHRCCPAIQPSAKQITTAQPIRISGVIAGMIRRQPVQAFWRQAGQRQAQ